MSELPGSVIVGIAGGTASGKSTMAESMRAALEAKSLHVVVIGTDSYFRRNDSSAPTLLFSLTHEQIFDCNHIDSADNTRLVRDIDSLSTSADHPDVIIVEGLMVLAAAEICERCELRLFVDLDDDVRLARRLLRDMNSGRGFTEPASIIRYYLESAYVGHRRYVAPSRMSADFVVRGDSEVQTLTALISPVIERLVKLREGEKV